MRRVSIVGIPVCSLVIVLCLFASESKGIERRWNNQEGNWHEPNNWEPNTSIPTVNDTAIIDQGVSHIVSADENAYALIINLGSARPSNGSLLIDTPRAVMAGQHFRVGYHSRGTVTQNSGLVLAPALHLGGHYDNDPTSDPNGVYYLNGGSLNPGQGYSQEWQRLYVGEDGGGSMRQTGGKVSGSICLGRGTGAVGVYELIGGEIACPWGPYQVANPLDVGFLGQGVFIQSGGSLGSDDNIILGSGSGGRGSFAQSGGSVLCAQALCLGIGNNSRATYNLSGGSLNASSIVVGAADNTEGVFVQSAGRVETIHLVIADQESHARGTYHQQGGTLIGCDLLCTGWLGGTLMQSAGSTAFVVGGVATDELTHWAGKGYIQVSGGSMHFEALTVGGYGRGYFKQTGGVVHVQGGTATPTLLLGEWSWGNGTYELNNASLVAGTISAGQGEAVFLLSGGSYAPPTTTFGPDLVNTGGVLRPGTWSCGTVNFASGAEYIQGDQGALEITINASSADNWDRLTGLAACSLDGLLHVACGDTRPRECSTRAIIISISESGISGDFDTITTNLTLGPDPAHPEFFERVADTGGTYVLRMRGLTAGDCNRDRYVDGGDLALMGGNWMQSGMTWAQGDFTGDGIVDGGDLALLGGNWWWTCPTPEVHTGGEGKCGGEQGKFDDGGLNLSDRDGDGDFDVDDMLIIIKEMNDPSKQDPHARDSSATGIPDDVLFDTGSGDEILEDAGMTDAYPDGGEDANSPTPDGTYPSGLPPEMLPLPPPAPPPDPSAPSTL